MKSNNKIRWGIIGASKIAKDFIKDFALLQNAELVAIAASSKSRAIEYSNETNIPIAYTYDEMYNSNKVDAVYISTTHNFHFEQAKLCLLNGKAVLCEKPITINDIQFKELVDIAKAKNVFLMEALWTYFLPAINKAKQWVLDGKIGALKMLQADFSFAVEKNVEGRMYNPHLAGGALLDLGVYPISAATYFMNIKPNSIVASGIITTTGVDACTAIILNYGNAMAALNTSMETKMTNTLRLFGEKGCIEVPDFWRANCCKLLNKELTQIDIFYDERVAHGFIYQMQHATDCILHNKKESDIATFERTNIVQEIMTEVRGQMGLAYPSEKS